MSHSVTYDGMAQSADKTAAKAAEEENKTIECRRRRRLENVCAHSAMHSTSFMTSEYLLMHSIFQVVYTAHRWTSYVHSIVPSQSQARKRWLCCDITEETKMCVWKFTRNAITAIASTKGISRCASGTNITNIQQLLKLHFVASARVCTRFSEKFHFPRAIY